MSQLGNCPSVNDWRNFVLGHTSEDEAEQLEAHLAGCKECLGIVHGLRTEDALVTAVRGQSGADEPESVVVTALIARLEAAARSGRADRSSRRCRLERSGAWHGSHASARVRGVGGHGA